MAGFSGSRVPDGGIPDGGTPDGGRIRRSEELRLFLFLTVVLAPVLSLSIVGAYGLVIWVSQMVGA